MKILIADSLDEFRSALADLLRSGNQIQTAGDGVQTLRQLSSFKPDILVLDMMMPGLDGISILQEAAQQGLHPAILATTRFYSDYIRYACEQMSVSYLMVKPCDIRATAARVLDLSRQRIPATTPETDPRAQISNILQQLGIFPKLSGYAFLREAILLLIRHPDQALTKELYPAVAAQCNSTAIQVERSIRSAIQSTWVRRDDGVWRQYLPTSGGTVPRPTNAVFICRLADRLRLSRDSISENGQA